MTENIAIGMLGVAIISMLIIYAKNFKDIAEIFNIQSLRIDLLKQKIEILEEQLEQLKEQK